MKKQLQNLFFGALLIGTATSIAQPSLTASNMNPSAGEAFTYFSSANPVSPGNSGANQTWNLTALSSTSSAMSSIVNSASTPSGSSFPMATLASTTSGSSNYSYFTPNSTGYLNYGVIGNGVVISYSDPEVILSYPFNFNSTNTDTWTATFTSGSQIIRTGTTTITADGYGTLITPAGTFTNVMRVHLLQTYKDSSMGFVFYNYINDEYMWYKPGVHQAVAYTYSLSVNGSPAGSVGGYLNGASVNLTTLSPRIENINIFPNPSTDHITINFNGLETKEAEIQIYSVTGQKLKSITGIEVDSGSNNIDVITTDLSPGVYFMKLYADGILSKNERFVVAK